MKELVLSDIEQVSGGFLNEIACLTATASGGLLGTWGAQQAFAMFSPGVSTVQLSIYGYSANVASDLIVLAGGGFLGAIGYGLTSPKN